MTPMARFILPLVLAVLPAPVFSQTAEEAPSTGFSYIIRPAFSFLMSTVQKPEGEAITVNMYGQLRSQYTFDIGDVHFKSYFNADLMRQADSDAPPSTLRDELVFTLIPSVVIVKAVNLSLFLELTMETRMTNGQQDGYPTRFMDPAFFYQTLYVGQWHEWKSDDEKQRLSVRYGIGYAFQQTVRSRFLLTGERAFNIDPENPLSAVRQAPSAKLESGYSAIFALEYSNAISDVTNTFVQMLGVMLSKDPLGDVLRRSHAVAQVGAGITYKMFAFRYDLRVVRDPNFSLRRQLDQTASLGIQLEIKD